MFKILQRLFAKQATRPVGKPAFSPPSSPSRSDAVSERGFSWSPPDETLELGEVLSQVTSASDIVPGSVIRIWHKGLRKWIPGWWCEVMSVNNGRVYLKDLKTGKQQDRDIESTTGSAWKHPNPARLRELGGDIGAKYQDELTALRRHYESLDFSSADKAHLVATLRSELEWEKAHMSRYHDMEEEFTIHEIALVKVGEELNRRGGFGLMQEVCKGLGSPRSLDTSWNGIGDWRG